MATCFEIVKIFDVRPEFRKPVIVPTEYLSIIQGSNLKYVRYLPPPYNSDDIECIRSFVQDCVLPIPDNWVDYKCITKAYAGINNFPLTAVNKITFALYYNIILIFYSNV